MELYMKSILSALNLHWTRHLYLVMFNEQRSVGTENDSLWFIHTLRLWKRSKFAVSDYKHQRFYFWDGHSARFVMALSHLLTALAKTDIDNKWVLHSMNHSQKPMADMTDIFRIRQCLVWTNPYTYVPNDQVRLHGSGLVRGSGLIHSNLYFGNVIFLRVNDHCVRI